MTLGKFLNLPVPLSPQLIGTNPHRITERLYELRQVKHSEQCLSYIKCSENPLLTDGSNNLLEATDCPREKK